ncbi:MAG: hypothetical protein HUK19_05945 [Fibrobacter sp.]|nr:hypothetical protein [Fibrobacter sp.]
MNWNVAKAAVEKYALKPAERDVLKSHGSALQEVIPSTMGEPLLYTHFDELLDLCRLLKVKVNLTTNGTFPGFWGTDDGMKKLLDCCSDIKVSTLASECFEGWKSNVEKLAEIKKRCGGETSVISLQVTLHKENLMMVPEVIAWAEAVGVARIKWNTVIFLSTAPRFLVEKYGLSRECTDQVRRFVKGFAAMGGGIKHEGNLFFEKRVDGRLPDGSAQDKIEVEALSPEGSLPEASLSEGSAQDLDRCGFADELWILPDGTEQRCPNPERRFGNPRAPEAQCRNCPMGR